MNFKNINININIIHNTSLILTKIQKINIFQYSFDFFGINNLLFILYLNMQR